MKVDTRIPSLAASSGKALAARVELQVERTLDALDLGNHVALEWEDASAVEVSDERRTLDSRDERVQRERLSDHRRPWLVDERTIVKRGHQYNRKIRTYAPHALGDEVAV